MAEQFDSYNLGVTWTEFGDQDRPDLDKLLDSRPELTPQQRSKLVSLWKRHPDRQQGKKSIVTFHSQLYVSEFLNHLVYFLSSIRCAFRSSFFTFRSCAVHYYS